MAFCDLKPVRIFDENSGCTYIIGEVFAIYTFGSERPVVYSWDMMTSVTINRRYMAFSAGNRSVKIDNKLFAVPDDYFRALTLVEYMYGKYCFPYTHEKRMFPLKSAYVEVAPGKDAYFGEGEVDENDTAAAFIMMMNIKLVRVLWLIALLIMLLIFGLLNLFIGVSRSNLLYFIPISIAGGGIVTLLVYIICHAIAKGRYRALADGDLASGETITFVISTRGFAACESSVYDGRDVVPWSVADYFVESDKMFILYRDKSAIAYIPKKAFDKKQLGGIADLITLRLEQK